MVGILFLVITGVISYNLTNASYAKWSSSVESKNIIKLSVKSGMEATMFATKTVGTNGLEQITHTIDNGLQVDNKFATEYRYRGGDSIVKNYVTFNNETWRIIGIIPTEDTNGNVENRFKLIKDKSIGNMYWNTNQDKTTNTWNNWVTGTLNIYLNNDYYNTLSADAKNMIGTTRYYLGGYSNAEITTDVMWQYERDSGGYSYYYGRNPATQSDADKKIAIMYASDYGYGASKECASNLRYYDDSTNCIKTNNWLDKSQNTLLLPQDSNSDYHVFGVYLDGYVYDDINSTNTNYAVRPVLSLSSKVQISDGEGTSDSPYQLTLTQ